jgi:hypothetical protein
MERNSSQSECVGGGEEGEDRNKNKFAKIRFVLPPKLKLFFE